MWCWCDNSNFSNESPCRVRETVWPLSALNLLQSCVTSPPRLASVLTVRLEEETTVKSSLGYSTTGVKSVRSPSGQRASDKTQSACAVRAGHVLPACLASQSSHQPGPPPLLHRGTPSSHVHWDSGNPGLESGSSTITSMDTGQSVAVGRISNEGLVCLYVILY